MKKPRPIGYIVTSQFSQGRPLQLCGPSVTWPDAPRRGALLLGDGATLFPSRRAATAAIRRTVAFGEAAGKKTHGRPYDWARAGLYRVVPVFAVAGRPAEKEPLKRA